MPWPTLNLPSQQRCSLSVIPGFSLLSSLHQEENELSSGLVPSCPLSPLGVPGCPSMSVSQVLPLAQAREGRVTCPWFAQPPFLGAGVPHPVLIRNLHLLITSQLMQSPGGGTGELCRAPLTPNTWVSPSPCCLSQWYRTACTTTTLLHLPLVLGARLEPKTHPQHGWHHSLVAVAHWHHTLVWQQKRTCGGAENWDLRPWCHFWCQCWVP